MSDVAYAWQQAPVAESPQVASAPWVEPPPRSIWQPVLMLLPLMLALGGAMFGAPFLIDMSFIVLALLMTAYLIGELRLFSLRFGMGGIVLFGGVLTWFCHDYFKSWFLVWLPHWHGAIEGDVVAKAAAFHMLYILSMLLGIRIRGGRWFARLLTKFPEPPSPSNYFWVIVITQIIGFIPYAAFTAEPFYLSMYHAIIGGRDAMIGTRWTVGRTGNVNYNYGAYVAQLLEVGYGGAILASFCLVFIKQSAPRNLFCVFTWLLWLAYGFGTGSRGQIVRLVLPAMAFVFIRYHVQAQELLHKYSARAYVAVAALLLAAVVLVQVQIRYRNYGFANVSLSDVSLTNIEGNEMFSASLMGFQQIPTPHPYFYDKFPGETIILPIPDFFFWAAVAPMPRAVWTSKPIDPSWAWYNAVMTGRTTVGGGQIEGTTISQGMVGWWYFRFGIAGVIEGGLFMGWLMGILERALYNNYGRPMAFFAALAILTWVFRSYRDADFEDLAEVLVILGGLTICIWIVRPIFRLIGE